MSQEEKVNAVYEMTMEMRGDLKELSAKYDNHREHIISNTLNIENNKKAIDGIIADRNKIIGIAWIVTALGGITGIVTIFLTLLKHV